jgi:2-oxoglutarate ferredoxin oxidoreductase subunit gamma
MAASKSKAATARREFEIRLSGSGGQGLQLSARIFARAFSDEGKIVAQSQSYEPTSRGGLSRSDLVVGQQEPDYPLATSIDFMLILDQVAVGTGDDIIADDALVVIDERLVADPPKGPFRVLSLPITQTAIKLGNPRVANIVALGVLVGEGQLCSRQIMESAIRDIVPKKFTDLNLSAFQEGLKLVSG